MNNKKQIKKNNKKLIKIYVDKVGKKQIEMKIYNMIKKK